MSARGEDAPVTRGEWHDAEVAYAKAKRAFYDARSNLRLTAVTIAPLRDALDRREREMRSICKRAPIDAIGCVTGHDCRAARMAWQRRSRS